MRVAVLRVDSASERMDRADQARALGVFGLLLWRQRLAAVVDGLEVVDVEGDERYLAALAPCARQLDPEALLEGAVVEQSRERIPDRLLQLLPVVARVLEGDGELVGEESQQLQLGLVHGIAVRANQREAAEVAAPRR